MSIEARKPIKVYVVRKSIGNEPPAFIPPDLVVVSDREKNTIAAATQKLCKCMQVDRDRLREICDITFLC
jgi:hypothetical protein